MVTHQGTQTIRRAVSVLKAFTEEQPEWRLADLAKSLRLNKTTAYRALVALEAEGLVARVPGRESYRLGPELIVMGSRALRTSDLRTAGRGALEGLAREVEETATLEVPVDGAVLILDEVQGPGMMGTSVDTGTRWPMHATSTGKALLAAMEAWQAREAVEAWRIPEVLPRLTPRTLTTEAELRAELAEIQERGYAVAFEELQLGYVAVGAAVRNHEGRPIAAIGVGGPTSRLTADRIPELGAAVRKTAERVSRSVGATPANPR